MKVIEMAKKYRALTRISLRQSSDPESPKYEQWHVWQAGAVFSPPAHLKSVAGNPFPDGAVAAGYVEEVK